MTNYKFSGKINLGIEEQPFTREIEAETKKHGKDKLYSQLTSEHNISRSKITIEATEEEA
ncbi:MAG: 50S ribosomal protein L18Ae [Candidatus Nanohalobium sp.]